MFWFVRKHFVRKAIKMRREAFVGHDDEKDDKKKRCKKLIEHFQRFYTVFSSVDMLHMIHFH